MLLFLGMVVDYKIVNIVIATCVKANQWAMVLKLYELMPLLAGAKFIPNQFTFSQSINAACKMKNVTAAMSILDDMLIKGQMLPPITTTSLLINTLESNGITIVITTYYVMFIFINRLPRRIGESL